MTSTGGHPTFHIDWKPEMDVFAQEHERELLEALNANPQWFFMVTCALATPDGIAICYAKRDDLSLNLNARLAVIQPMIDEIRMKAAMEGVIVMADPNSHWQAGWSHYGSMV